MGKSLSKKGKRLIIHHQPVFKDFIKNHILKKEDRVVLDATLGEGGHTLEFLEAGKKVIAFERNLPISIKAKERFHNFLKSGKLFIHQANFKDISEKVEMEVDLALFDLGISKYHYIESGQGFTFQKEEPLDMRLDKEVNDYKNVLSAKDIINNWKEKDLANLFYNYGEETLSRPCARLIVQVREREAILTTEKLSELIKKIYRKKKIRTQIHPATKIFQALRIAVNHELENLPKGVEGAITCLRTGGRVAVIAYHSLEDRLVKKIFRSITIKKNYNKYLPKHKQPKSSSKEFSLFNKKIIRPDKNEVYSNPSSRSACLRILTRIR